MKMKKNVKTMTKEKNNKMNNMLITKKIDKNKRNIKKK